MSNPHAQPLEDLAEFARQWRLNPNIDPSGTIYNVWFDNNATDIELNLNDIEAVVTLARKQASQIEAVREIANDLSAEAHRLYGAADAEKSPEFQHRARSRAQYLEGTSLNIRAALDDAP